MRILFAALFAVLLCGVTLAGDCACGPDCPCKADPLNPQGAAPVKAQPQGHYVKTCDGNGCKLTFVPDDTEEPPVAPAGCQSCSAPVRREGPIRSVLRDGPIRRFIHRRR